LGYAVIFTFSFFCFNIRGFEEFTLERGAVLFMVGKLLSLLRNISEVIAGVDDSAEVLSRVVKILATTLEVDVCSVYEFDPESDKLVLAATYGLNSDCVGEVAMNPREGLTGKAFRQRSIVNVDNPFDQPGFKYFENIGEEKFGSYMGVPLMTAGKCVGVLTLQRTASEKFPASVADMARSLSPQLANLILSAGILKKLAKDTAKEEREEESPASMTLKGIAVNSGVAMGKVFKIKTRDLFNEIDHATHGDTKAELKLFERALRLARINTLELETKALSMISEADASIFNSHLMFLEDKMILDDIRKEIEEDSHALEFAIVMVYRRFEKRFQQLQDNAFRERLIDFKDVMLRLLEAASFLRSNEQPQEELESRTGSWIVVANELLPSDLMRLPIDNVAGLVCEKGGVTSHVAILAKAFSIPALLGVRGVIEATENYDEALLDCHAEKIYINPDDKLRSNFEHLIEVNGHEEEVDKELSYTSDGEHVKLRANVSLICETSLLNKFGAEGIGLYRTEFLFMIRDYVPSEETQLEVFSKVMQESNGDVTLRLLDAGGDKQISCLNLPKEENPALGLRGIRLLMEYPDLFRTHLRAVLRAGCFGKLKILLPMVATLNELLMVKNKLAEVEQELEAEGIKFCRDYKIGIMLEVPAAVFGLNKFMEHIDFVSIGTNDLLQFTFALDRGRNEDEWTADSFDPVFLKLLSEAGGIVNRYPGKELTICGEMAGNPLAVPLLIGAGIKTFSMPPKMIPEIRKVVPSFSNEECRKILDEALEQLSAKEVTEKIKNVFDAKGLKDSIDS
jgi:phosphotransferase system enzyme I (PtsP)